MTVVLCGRSLYINCFQKQWNYNTPLSTVLFDVYPEFSIINPWLYTSENQLLSELLNRVDIEASYKFISIDLDKSLKGFLEGI